ncbi:alkaline shock response membrane anchor protein AmaP [Actinomadura rayongensis]|uniref:Alkaline shock response membrane anchor protein AmaP n=1 Tax=Actinomadura rayongensis TaxID=1429076 RepID=A0A6I4W2G2_9ACTN|nr:alkaline shock response membrane anchor protein AmaP [Actinomadura rayongensis]MXQ62880.1 alkaline shock response membrane anchor protein AmaP [Actinomadura rayongensis]
MDRQGARLNRFALALLGIVLLVLGGLGLALGSGVFGSGRSRAPVLSQGTRTFASGHGWFWWAVSAAAVVVGLLGLWWLLVQGRRDRVPELSMEPEPEQGTTRITAQAVTDALSDEIAAYPGVRGVGARIGGSSRRPRLFLTVAYARDADLAALRRRVTDEAIARLRTALEREKLPAVVRLRLVGGEEARTVL